MTDFVDEFRYALARNIPPGELVEIVLRYKARGMSQQSAYADLAQLRLQLPKCGILRIGGRDL